MARKHFVNFLLTIFQPYKPDLIRWKGRARDFKKTLLGEMHVNNTHSTKRLMRTVPLLPGGKHFTAANMPKFSQ